jgi:hypothetical protein
VFVTEYQTEGSLQLFDEKGVDCCFQKPLHPKDLMVLSQIYEESH